MNCEEQLKNLIISGGDERIFFAEGNNFNKYHINTLDHSNLINRGSCTCGNLNPETHANLTNIHLSTFEENFNKVVRHHAKQLKNLFHIKGKPDFEIFFAPSGSDLVYYPLLFSRLLYPDKDPLNILTCPEELGSGSQIATHGRYFSQYNQFNESLKTGSFLGKHIRPKVIMLPARDKKGHINDNRSEIIHLINDYSDAPKIVNLVYGSKSGIEENLYIIDEVKRPDILWTVDLCQFRNRKDLVNSLLSKGVILLITGSKFYQAPPFCGALLVPKKLCKRLVECDPSPVNDFYNIFSAFDIPECLPQVRKHLRSYKNMGLHLRWECALYEMIEYDKIDENKINSMILKWNAKIFEAITKSKYLDPMPDMELTNKSIISFRVNNDGHYLDNSELKSLFIKIVSKEYSKLNGYNKIFIGQPVKYESGSFLRLAIGSFDVRQYLKNEDIHFDNDLEIIKIIENEVKNFKKHIS